AGQPFQRAVRTHMDQPINALLAEPEIERDIGMARNAGEVVIVDIAAFDLAALGLHGDDGLAASDCGEMELAVTNLWVALGRAPGALQIVLQDLRKLLQRSMIFGNAPSQGCLAELLRK